MSKINKIIFFQEYIIINSLNNSVKEINKFLTLFVLTCL